MEEITITLTRDELDTVLTGLHYGMNWLRHIIETDDSLNESEYETFVDVLQEVWEAHDTLLDKTRLTAKKEE